MLKSIRWILTFNIRENEHVDVENNLHLSDEISSDEPDNDEPDNNESEDDGDASEAQAEMPNELPPEQNSEYLTS